MHLVWDIQCRFYFVPNLLEGGNMQVISSKDNELVKHIKKLKDKKYRDESNEYIVEGVKL